MKSTNLMLLVSLPLCLLTACGGSSKGSSASPAPKETPAPPTPPPPVAEELGLVLPPMPIQGDVTFKLKGADKVSYAQYFVGSRQLGVAIADPDFPIDFQSAERPNGEHLVKVIVNLKGSTTRELQAKITLANPETVNVAGWVEPGRDQVTVKALCKSHGGVQQAEAFLTRVALGSETVSLGVRTEPKPEVVTLGTAEAGTFAWTVDTRTLEKGEYRLRVVARNHHGVEGIWLGTLKVNNTPRVRLVDPPRGRVLPGRTLQLKGQVTGKFDGAPRLELLMDSKEHPREPLGFVPLQDGSFDWTLDLTGRPAGGYTLELRLLDNDGIAGGDNHGFKLAAEH